MVNGLAKNPSQPASYAACSSSRELDAVKATIRMAFVRGFDRTRRTTSRR